MTDSLYILDSVATRKIYNLCMKEGLGKKEISLRLYGKWIPNAVLPKIDELKESKYIQFIEVGKNIQKKRGVYQSTMLPVLKAMKSKSEWTKEEREFLESQTFRQLFLEFNKDLKLEDDWVRAIRVFLDDLLVFRIIIARNYKTINDIIRNRIKSYKNLKNTTKHCNSLQEITRDYNRLQEFIHDYNRFDMIIREIVRKHTNSYEITWKNKKYQGKPVKGTLRTDYTCLSLLMPELLCRRIKFTSNKGKILSMLEGDII